MRGNNSSRGIEFSSEGGDNSIGKWEGIIQVGDNSRMGFGEIQAGEGKFQCTPPAPHWYGYETNL